MWSGVVALVTDHPKRSAPLAEAIQAVTGCTLLGSDVDWSGVAPPAAVVLDLDLVQAKAAQCLIGLRRQPWAEGLPVLSLAYRLTDKALRQAQLLGADACLPFFSDPHVIVTALLNLADPAEGPINATVRQCAGRAAAALGELFQAASAARRITLEAVDRTAEPMLRAVQQGGLARWLNTIRAHDDATYQHCLVVAGLAAQFASSVRFPAAQQLRLVRTALVHDVGKALIPRALLLKRGTLDPAEVALMREHTMLGYQILKAGGDADPAMLDGVRHHHEMLDGSGYPDGLSGDAISDVVRFLAICDVYAALTARRPYRPALSSDAAMRELHGMAGRLEPRFVAAFGQAVARAA